MQIKSITRPRIEPDPGFRSPGIGIDSACKVRVYSFGRISKPGITAQKQVTGIQFEKRAELFSVIGKYVHHRSYIQERITHQVQVLEIIPVGQTGVVWTYRGIYCDDLFP